MAAARREYFSIPRFLSTTAETSAYNLQFNGFKKERACTDGGILIILFILIVIWILIGSWGKKIGILFKIDSKAFKLLETSSSIDLIYIAAIKTSDIFRMTFEDGGIFTLDQVIDTYPEDHPNNLTYSKYSNQSNVYQDVEYEYESEPNIPSIMRVIWNVR